MEDYDYYGTHDILPQRIKKNEEKGYDCYMILSTLFSVNLKETEIVIEFYQKK